ncbi:transcriptional regulator, MarR family [Alkaliphilus metalliredigens QYMF]|uniref:Transcriptional regulator, MarR family n=1 Tax=Alkaliphilus metalliredigens (strain QYMF) TaxID=293826 RepID=A6TLG9_ALKMQ|nr:MarR family winged helix-turn-helix transcriptional regulator [Alkaliphilus metalliredigens]ABR47037.1 transcriptional regulator, MarR family [Alkaliphilus metalliredigens QYMF]
MGSYYSQIYEYTEKAVKTVLSLDRKGIKNDGDQLTISELLLLKEIGEQKEGKMAEVMEALALDRNVFATMLGRVQSSRYVTKKRCRYDGRVYLLMLTDKGKDTVYQIFEREKGNLFHLLGDFTFNEEKAILKFLVKLDMLHKEKSSNGTEIKITP